jgi:radical SAM superfamily enzyme YgiQ (UPF0313 family)
MERVFCISAGQLIVKKKDTLINRQNRYLNYGLLSLATTLSEDGWNTLQIQGLFDSPATTVNTCVNSGFSALSTLPVLISVPSFYAISWVNEFISLIKEINSKIKIVIGGRWVIANRSDLMQELVPSADIVFSGLADFSIGKVVSSCVDNDYSTIRIVNKNKNPQSLNYSLLHERELYQPSLEVSRGCGMGCGFCQEKDEKLSPLKNPATIVEEAKSILIYDNLNEMNLYFESSMFIPSKSWLEALIESRERLSLNFNWRTESRVDTINPKFVKLLSRSGLKVLDLGLESASHSQLLNMKKTKNPRLYLERASELLKECYLNGVLVKINILLFAGETNKTISETMEWLHRHRKYITGISAGPVIVFGWESDTESYVDELRHYGASKSYTPTDGVLHLKLSDEINHERAMEISKDISSEFMSEDNYFYLKSFSYFSRDYTNTKYMEDLLGGEIMLTG